MAERANEHWFEKAADCMIREGKTLFWFSNQEDLGITSKECDAILRTKGFQEVLRTRRNVYYKELATDPSLSRAAVEGQLVAAINGLLANNQFDKAATAIMQYAKIKGWTTEQTNVNVFNELTAGGIQQLKDKLAAKANQPVH